MSFLLRLQENIEFSAKASKLKVLWEFCGQTSFCFVHWTRLNLPTMVTMIDNIAVVERFRQASITLGCFPLVHLNFGKCVLKVTLKDDGEGKVLRLPGKERMDSV